MRIDCRLCKKDLTSETIALFEGKTDRVICPCKKESETKKEYYKAFDRFLATLRKHNDTTDY